MCFSTNDEYLNSLSKYLGLSIGELMDIQKEHGDLESYFKLPAEKVSQIESYSSSGGNSKKHMTDDQWEEMKKESKKGDILVSKDQTTFTVNHGHAAIVYKNGERTVEHTGTGKSDDYPIETSWRNIKTMRIYYLGIVDDESMVAIADYAFDNLKGKDYDMLANRKNKKKVNCATLVWQAYDSQDFQLNYAPSGSVTPMCFVEEEDLILMKGVNWDTGDHEW
jgi:uncharacterized protein YycO